MKDQTNVQTRRSTQLMLTVITTIIIIIILIIATHFVILANISWR